jgi:hypothetical protein
MITTLQARAVVAVTALRTVLTVHVTGGIRPALEVAGFLCAGIFLHQVWSPLVWAAAAVVLVLAGQRR